MTGVQTCALPIFATIIPFDVEKILSGGEMHQHAVEVKPVVQPKIKSTQPVMEKKTSGPMSHYDENIQPINKAVWRKRAHIRGQVSSIKVAPSGGAPRVDVEVWDETGGITLQFLARRGSAGLDVGKTICAEGMVGEQEGSLTILNPSYEIIR
mgnify:FL=1